MADFYTAQVERDDLRLFFNACLSATSQQERDSHVYFQRVGLDFLHTYIRVNYRSIYAALGTLPINDHNRQRIVAELLANPESGHSSENAQIFKALNLLPVHRVYKLFALLAEQRVNNRRTRKMMYVYLKQRNNLAFDVVKYRRLLRIVLRHIHYPLSEEMHTFLFKAGWRKRVYATPLLETFRQAHFSEQAIYELPFTIAEGLAARKQISRERFLKRIAPQLSEHEAWSLQNAYKDQQRPLIRADKKTLIDIFLYGLSYPQEAHGANYLNTYFKKSRLKADTHAYFKSLKIAVVLDNSYSTMGSRQRKNRPLATAVAMDQFLKHIDLERYHAFWSTAPQAAYTINPFSMQARGPTGLADGFVQALQCKPDWIIVVSDGRENRPVQGIAWVLRQVNKHKLGPLPLLLHLNPVWNPRTYQPRILAPEMVTLGIREVESLPMLMTFAAFFQGHCSQAALLQKLMGDF